MKPGPDGMDRWTLCARTCILCTCLWEIVAARRTLTTLAQAFLGPGARRGLSSCMRPCAQGMGRLAAARPDEWVHLARSRGSLELPMNRGALVCPPRRTAIAMGPARKPPPRGRRAWKDHREASHGAPAAWVSSPAPRPDTSCLITIAHAEPIPAWTRLCWTRATCPTVGRGPLRAHWPRDDIEIDPIDTGSRELCQWLGQKSNVYHPGSYRRLHGGAKRPGYRQDLLHLPQDEVGQERHDDQS